MPVMYIYRAPAVTPQDYDDVRRRARWEEAPPSGGIAHFISFSDEGALEVDVWETREAHDAYWTKRHEPVLKRLGIDMGRPEIIDLHGVAIADAVQAYQMPRSPDRPTVTRVLETDALA